MNISRVGVDIAKSVFHVHGVDRHEQPQWRGKYTRAKWLDAVCRRVPQGAIIGMEACATAHYWARQLQAHSCQVKLVAAQFVKPYVKTNKNDRADAEAICEALGRPTMRFVAIKSVEQQDAQATHRIREELISQRTAKANQIRGLVGEYGLIAPTGIQQLRRALPLWLEDASNGLSDHFRRLLAELANDLRYLDDRVEQLTTAIEKHANTDPVARRLMTLRGIRPLPPALWPVCWVTALSINVDATLLRHWGLPRVSTARADESACWGSASEATGTCASCWCMAHDPFSVMR